MFRHSRTSRWLCLVLVLPWTAGPAFGADGIISDMLGPPPPGCNVPACTGPGCNGPGCNAARSPAPCCGSGPCPANVRYFGYYPTHWRRWPGTEPMPTPAPPLDRSQRVEVPPPSEEAIGKPGATTNDTDSSTQSGAPQPGASTTQPGGATTEPSNPATQANPANPNGAVPGAAAPMLNGLPVPSGTQLPGGKPVPTVPLPTGAPVPSGTAPTNGAVPQNSGLIPNTLPAPSQTDPAAKGSQLLAPMQMPVAELFHPTPSEPIKLKPDWPTVAPAAAAPEAASEATSAEVVFPADAASVTAPSVAVPSASAPAAVAPAAIPPSATAPTEIVPAPTATEIGQRITPEIAPASSYQWPPANMLRSSTIRAGFQSTVEPALPTAARSGASAASLEPLPPLGTPNSRAAASMPINSLRIDMPPISRQAWATKPKREVVDSENSISLVTTAEKPAQAATIPTDDWQSASEKSAAPCTTATNAPTDSTADNMVTARFPIPADSTRSETAHPASWIDRSESTPAAETAPPANSPKPLNWPAANSPAALAPIYRTQTVDRPFGYASPNAPGTIATTARPSTQIAPAAEIRFSPLRDAVASVHLSPEEAPGDSMTAIDPLAIGRAMADDQQPAMRALPIQNGLPTNRFEASDYVSPDRASPATYASTHRPTQVGAMPGAGRMTDAAVQPASFEQANLGAAPALNAIDPLEVARSLSATPAPSGR